MAINRTRERHRFKRKKIRFTEQLKEQARAWLEEDKLSPELISATWKKLNQPGVSHETLYDWIWRAKKSHNWSLIQDRGLYKHLRHGKRKQKTGNYRQNSGVIKERVPIDQQPDLNEISDQTIADIEQKINNRPIRKFNYLTPKEKLLSYKTVALIT